MTPSAGPLKDNTCQASRTRYLREEVSRCRRPPRGCSVKRTTGIRGVSRRWSALVLFATWSIGGAWDVSHAAVHAFEHAESDHHAALDTTRYTTRHEEHQDTSELALAGGDHGHDHPKKASVLSTAKPRFESLCAITSVVRKSASLLQLRSPQTDRETSVLAGPGAPGSSGPRAPPLS